jgi:acetyl esterase/lipase
MHKKTRFTLIIILLIAAIFATRIYNIRHINIPHDNYIPETISKEAQKNLAALYQERIYDLKAPMPENYGAWKMFKENIETGRLDLNLKAAADNHVTFTEIKLGKIPVLDIRPAYLKNTRNIIVYLHGGAYTCLSPKTTLQISAPISNASSKRIIVIDYTTAPFADWMLIQKQVIEVFKALLKQGYQMKDIAVLGDSAGGGLALNTIISMRDQGLGMPAAVILLSPWADLTNRGDTPHTLANSDPILDYHHLLLNSALAYAHGLDLADPRISPVYADYTKGFPPTLIIEGTKCTFLSTSVRLYQAMEKARQKVKLEMYEGMWHVFMSDPMPESTHAIKKISDFINTHTAA